MSDSNSSRMRPVYVVFTVVVLSVLGVGYAYNSGQLSTSSARGFTDADVAKVEQSITTEFARRNGLRVREVKMVRESSTRLTGIAKVDIPSLGMVDKECEASLGAKGLPVWQCR